MEDHVFKNRLHFISHYKKKHGSGSMSSSNKIIAKLLSVERDLKEKIDTINKLSIELNASNSKVSSLSKSMDKMKAEFDAKLGSMNKIKSMLMLSQKMCLK